MNFKVTLIGHSMGAIIVNRALQMFPDLPVDNIVYMASADNLQNFLNITVPFVEKNRCVNVYSLHLHPQNEDRELSFYGILPSGSLLVWIDHTYDEPQYILQKTSGRWDNMRRILTQIDRKLRKRFHFKIFGRLSDPENTSKEIGPQKHGQFDELMFQYWTPEFW